MNLSEIQKKAREEFEKFSYLATEEGGWYIPYEETRNDKLMTAWLDSQIREAYLAGARDYEEAIRLEEWEVKQHYATCMDCMNKKNTPCETCRHRRSHAITKNEVLSALKEKSRKFFNNLNS